MRIKEAGTRGCVAKPGVGKVHQRSRRISRRGGPPL